MNIGERIKNRRKELGMSAEQIADIIGTSPATIYRYESNYITKMGVDKLTPIARALHVSEAYLMGWTDDASWLPDDEKLLSVVHRLTPEAQGKVLEYAEDLLASKKYARASDYEEAEQIAKEIKEERGGDPLEGRVFNDYKKKGLFSSKAKEVKEF